MTFPRITHRPDQMAGVPCIRGLRIPVTTVLNMLEDGMTAEEILNDFPDLEPEDIREAIRYEAAVRRTLRDDKGRDTSLRKVLRNTPPGHDWLFYANDDPRMHLQTVGTRDRYKVWLERDGRWCIEKATTIPPSIFDAVRYALEHDPLFAKGVRAEWMRHIMATHRLALRVSGHHAVITAYPGTPHAFERKVDLSAHAPPSWYARPEDVGFDPETAALAIGKVSKPENQWVLIELGEVLWI